MDKVLSKVFAHDEQKRKKYSDIFLQQEIDINIFVYNAYHPVLKAIWLQMFVTNGIDREDLMEILIESAITKRRKYYYTII